MNTYSIYSTENGAFQGKSIFCNSSDLICNVQDGFSFVIGIYDRLSQRVDLATGLVIDYQPPQPSINHAWDSETKRWLYVKTDADIAAEVRAHRDKLMTACDWLTVRAMDGIPIPQDWQDYRSALRDITQQAGFPRSINWPESPQ